MDLSISTNSVSHSHRLTKSQSEWSPGHCRNSLNTRLRRMIDHWKRPINWCGPRSLDCENISNHYVLASSSCLHPRCHGYYLPWFNSSSSSFKHHHSYSQISNQRSNSVHLEISPWTPEDASYRLCFGILTYNLILFISKSQIEPSLGWVWSRSLIATSHCNQVAAPVNIEENIPPFWTETCVPCLTQD